MRKESKFIRRIAISLSLSISLSLISAGLALAEGADRDGRLLTSGPPIFPSYCLSKGLQGYVDFVFVVGTDGLVHDPTVLDAVVYRRSPAKPVDDEKARQAFVSAAKAALANYRYEPPMKNGKLIRTEGVRTRITFAIRG
ncbi:MAG: hypothetical protein AAFX56_08005 [Pseudomonadota bacterium]